MKFIALIFCAIFSSCTYEETTIVNEAGQVVTTPPEETPVPVDPVEELPTIPKWLRGEYQSRWFPNSEAVTFITETDFAIDLTDLSNIVYIFNLYDIDSEEAEGVYTVHYYDGVDITFFQVDDPSSTDIKIHVNDNGIIYEYGWFKKLSD